MRSKLNILCAAVLTNGAAAEPNTLTKIGIMCDSRPGSLGLLQKDHAIIAIDRANKQAVIKSHFHSNRHISFRVNSDDINIWASGNVDEDTGLPFIWLSKKLNSEYFSLEYFNSCSVSILINGVPGE
jgi:hypothetical protein